MSAPHSMGQAVTDYLGARRRLGFELRCAGRQLLEFARYSDARGRAGHVRREVAIAWAAAAPSGSRLACARRLANVRGFARYQAVRDPANELVPDGLFGPARRRLTPYIYSDEEIRDLLRVTQGLRPVGGLRPVTFQTLFGLLAASGLRVSEALQLRREDVDLERGVLTIREGKFHHSRCVPLHPTVVTALRRYAARRDAHCRCPQCRNFFIRDDGTSVGYDHARQAFRQLRRALRWRPNTHGRLPRIHDLRHHFVCARLLAWYRDGADIDVEILNLSRYLGHSNPANTYWYVTGIPALMAIATRRFETFAQRGEAS